MKAITQANLESMLADIKGATFATLTTSTDPRLKKTGNTLGTVRKVSRVNVTLGFQYEAAVNRQRTREGLEADFEATERQWGEHISPMLIENNGKKYLQTKVEKSLETKYVDAKGQELSSETVAPFLPARSKNEHQETEKEILVRDYKLESIIGISFKGEEYVLIPG